MMVLSSNRFTLSPTGLGGVWVRDKNTPYHLHIVEERKVPSVKYLSLITEEDFDLLIKNLVYGGEER